MPWFAEIDLDLLARHPACASRIFVTSSSLVIATSSCTSSFRLARRCMPVQGERRRTAMGYETDLKLFIDGAWKSRRRPRHAHARQSGRQCPGIAEVPYATKSTPTRRSRPSKRAWPGWRLTSRSRSAARSLHKTADPAARTRRGDRARTLTQEQGNTDCRGQGRSDRQPRAIVRLVCRGHQARLWPHARPPRGPAEPA